MISPDKNTAIILAMYHVAVEYLEENKKFFKKNGKYSVSKIFECIPKYVLEKDSRRKNLCTITVDTFSMKIPRFESFGMIQMFANQNGQNAGFYVTKDENGLQYHVNRTLQKYLAAGF